MGDEVLLIETAGGVRTLTMNRPQARNALSAELRDRLVESLLAAEDDPDVRAVVLTGADPAFCAGLDLREVGSTGLRPGSVTEARGSVWWALHGMSTPVIGAVNGACVTGGLELALQCSFLVASERAVFADTHARVGFHPGGGLIGLLPQAVGIRTAKEMSLTGNFIDAAEAHRLGLVNHVVPHAELLALARKLAADIAEGDARTVGALNDSYRDVAALPLGAGLALERERFKNWKYDQSEIEARRQAVINRARTQT
ncbi:MAG TPA: enoyl-CoA hydratase [Acidimicrobiia bacterium]|nr:enoyl-CoA hydratase [Acidimicrobiia bacterium]